jgi:hypothetical protein
VSGDQPRVVDLVGPVKASLVQALPEIERRLDRRITVVGGLAVLSRLGSAAHRVTSDVDTVNRRLGGEPGKLDVLLATGATSIDESGTMVATPTGDVWLDVLEVSEEQLDDLPADPTDLVYLLSHDWACVRQHHCISVPSVAAPQANTPSRSPSRGTRNPSFIQHSGLWERDDEPSPESLSS